MFAINIASSGHEFTKATVGPFPLKEVATQYLLNNGWRPAVLYCGDDPDRAGMVKTIKVIRHDGKEVEVLRAARIVELISPATPLTDSMLDR